MWHKVDLLLPHGRLESDGARAVERLNFYETTIFIVKTRCLGVELIEYRIQQARRGGDIAVTGKGNMDALYCFQVIRSQARQHI